MLRWVLGFLILLHGLMHLIGVINPVLSEHGPTLHRPVSPGFIGAWLTCTLLFVLASLLIFVRSAHWWMAAAPAVVLSQVLILFWWTDARFGTVANVIILAALTIKGAGFLPGGLQADFARQAREHLARPARPSVITEADLAPLPPPVQRYLRFVGVIGREGVANFRARFKGQISTAVGAAPGAFEAEQYTFYDHPARLFLIESARWGVPFAALHEYVGPHATMRVKLASLIQVVDAKGPEMDRSETVTMFNDMCLLAPATLIDPAIRWQVVDGSTVRATFSNAGQTISAVLRFGPDGALVNFTSGDRSQTADGKTFLRYPWSTPVAKYRDYRGFRLLSEGVAIWHQPDGDYQYASLLLDDIEYNVAR